MIYKKRRTFCSPSFRLLIDILMLVQREQKARK